VDANISACVLLVVGELSASQYYWNLIDANNFGADVGS